MIMAYADETYYISVYRTGAEPPVSGPAFNFYARTATKEIRARTFGNIDESGEIPDEVKMCCCEVAEKLHNIESAKDSNGLVLQSYSNDGESGTYLASDLTDSGVSAALDGIVRSWLLDTGLMYCGVRK